MKRVGRPTLCVSMGHASFYQAHLGKLQIDVRCKGAQIDVRYQKKHD